jgi:predicted ATPase
MIAAPVFCRRFIGRSDELRAVADVCRQAGEGRGAVVLVGGEAGIGKTRFLGEAYATLGGVMRIVEAQCFENVQSPLGPFSEILGELDAGAIESGGDRLAQFVAIMNALRRATATQPALIAIEDVHWADLATLAFLQYLTAKIGALKIVLVLTFRSDELHRTHPLTPVLAKLERSRQVRRLDLRALSEAEMRAFVASALEGHDALEQATIRDILDVAEGSPLFAEELLKHAVERAAAGVRSCRSPSAPPSSTASPRWTTPIATFSPMPPSSGAISKRRSWRSSREGRPSKSSRRCGARAICS